MQRTDGTNSGDRPTAEGGRGTDLRSMASLDAMGMLDAVDAAEFDRAFRDAVPSLQAELRELQASIAADPAFLAASAEEPASDLKARTIARVMTNVERQEEQFAPIAHIGRTAARAERRPVRSIDAHELVEQAMELAALRKDAERFSRSSYYWRAAAIALTAALTVALIFQGTTSTFAQKVTEIALGTASSEDLLKALGREGAREAIEQADVLRGIRAADGSGLGAAVLAVDLAAGRVTVVGLGLKAGSSYSVRHVAEGGTVTELGTFVAHRASWSAEFAVPGMDLKSLGGGSIELVDGDGTVVMRS